mgnify:CR=1 FL=1
MLCLEPKKKIALDKKKKAFFKGCPLQINELSSFRPVNYKAHDSEKKFAKEHFDYSKRSIDVRLPVARVSDSSYARKKPQLVDKCTDSSDFTQLYSTEIELKPEQHGFFQEHKVTNELNLRTLNPKETTQNERKQTGYVLKRYSHKRISSISQNKLEKVTPLLETKSKPFILETSPNHKRKYRIMKSIVSPSHYPVYRSSINTPKKFSHRDISGEIYQNPKKTCPNTSAREPKRKVRFFAYKGSEPKERLKIISVKTPSDQQSYKKFAL